MLHRIWDEIHAWLGARLCGSRENVLLVCFGSPKWAHRLDDRLAVVYLFSYNIHSIDACLKAAIMNNDDDLLTNSDHSSLNSLSPSIVSKLHGI
jgi:hypothetical protein